MMENGAVPELSEHFIILYIRLMYKHDIYTTKVEDYLELNLI